MRFQYNAHSPFFLCIQRLFSLFPKPARSVAVVTAMITGCITSAHNNITSTTYSDAAARIPTESKKPALSKPNSSSAVKYLVSTYIKNPAASAPYCLVYGNPKTARVVLIVWTALSCPLCSRLHQGPLLTLKKLANTRGDFALILRDYPTDPISLQGSAMVWSLGEKPVPDIMHRLYVTHDWMNPLSKALDALEILTLQSATSAAEQAKVRSAKTDENLHKTVFYSRASDQEALDLTQVPWAIVLEKQGEPVSSDLKNREKSQSPKQKSKARLQQSAPLAQAAEHTNVEKTGLQALADWTMHVLGTPNMDLDQNVAKYLPKN